MKYELAATEPAAARYLAAHRAIEARHPPAAARFAAAVEKALSKLQEFPRLGFVVPDYAALGVREVIVQAYRLWYIVDDRRRRVVLVALWHGAQLAERLELPADL